MVFKLEAANASEFLLWVKWVLTNAKTVLSFVITLKSAKKSEEWERQAEKHCWYFNISAFKPRAASDLQGWIGEGMR